MPPDSPFHRRNHSTPDPSLQSIPLQDLGQQQDQDQRPQQARQGGGDDAGAGIHPSHRRTLSDRGRSLFRRERQSILHRAPLTTYAPIEERSPSPPQLHARPHPSPRLSVTTPSGEHARVDDAAAAAAAAAADDDDNDVFSPIGPSYQDAVGGFSGISFSTHAPAARLSLNSQRSSPASRTGLPTLRTVGTSPGSLVDEDLDDTTDYFPPESDADTVPLTDVSRLQPSSHEPSSPSSAARGRGSFQSVRFLSPGPSTPAARDDRDVESGHLTPDGRWSRSPDGARNRSLSPSAAESPLHRAGTMMRKMSMRVVNLSNEPEIIERTRRVSSMAHPRPDLPRLDTDVSAFSQDGAASVKSPASEKAPSPVLQPVDPPLPPRPEPNPLRGKSLGIFSPDSRVRLFLMDVLLHPFIEPFILVLIIIQTILLAADARGSVYLHPRSPKWGTAWNDYALLALFVIYTIEIIVKVIVSGFVINPIEYSTIDRQIGLRQAVKNKANDMFALHRSNSAKNAASAFHVEQPSLLRTFTAQNMTDAPGGSRVAQKKRLAHRAFLRHSFNRLDFVAVVSFWVSFVIGIFGVESQKHVYVFRMLSCLRILRLLLISSGTSVILRSLKRSAPTLLNVGFLIGFFWLLLAIIGVQSFKSSLRRTCVWIDQANEQDDWTYDFQFCGGYLDSNYTPQPWLLGDMQTPGAKTHKGYLCPVNSLCVEGTNPYNGTVSFDNMFQSLELVFVIMTSNTFSDLLYYTTNSDYLAGAIFFAAGIVIFPLWLINLLIAVITSSFQVIRDESKASAFTAQDTETGTFNHDHEHSEKPRKRVSKMKDVYDKTSWVWVAVILYGLIVQCLRSDNMNPWRASFIKSSELGVTLVLLFEICFRFVVDWRHFFRSKRNIVDLFLAVITTVIQIPVIRNSGQPYAWLTFFQIVRIYRVVLAVDLTRNLIMTVLGNFFGLTNLILFVFLLCFLVAIFASQIFRGELPYQSDSGETLVVSFFTIWNSFLGMYQIFSSENWTTIMYNVTAYNVIYDNGWIGAAFCIIWFILANFIVLNMFIAVIQENFDVSEDEKRLQQVKAFLSQRRFGQAQHGTLSLSAIFKIGQARRQDPLDFGSAATEMLLKDAVVRDFLDDEEAPVDVSPNTAGVQDRVPTTVKTGVIAGWWEGIVQRLFNRDPNPFYSRLEFSKANEELDPRQMAKEVVLATDRRKRAQREYLRNHPKYNVSLYLFKVNNPIRKLCQRIVGPGRGGDRIEGVPPSTPVWYAFSAFIYAAIVAMVLLACVTTPLYQKEYFETHGFSVKNWFVFSDMGFAALFTVESAIRVVADGFFWTPNAYYRSSWGFIDGVVLLTLWANIIALLYNPSGGSRAVGAFKALRALRLLNVSDSARDTFHSVIVMGGWKVISAAFVSLSFLVPFAIYGLNLFNGKMQSCNDDGSNIFNLTDCTGEYLNSPFNWNVLSPRQVSNSYYDFDNFPSALFILFQIVSQEGWIDVMWSGQSITGVFTQPNPFTAQGNAVFFVIFNLLGAVFVLTLFVSVFMRNYTEQTGVAFLTTDQRAWLELRKLLRQVSPSKRPSSKKVRESWKEWCYRRAVTKNGRWQRTMTACLVFHLILLCLEWYPSYGAWLRTRDFIFLGLTVFYIANIVIRIIGLSWARFRRSSWDLYSIASVSGTFVTTILLLSNFQQRDYVQLHKLFLVSIALMLIPRNNQLDQLFKTAAASLTPIANLLATWFVLFLVYAIAFTQTFGLTRFNSNETDNINFRTVPKALILLFRMSSGEGWNQIMNDFETVVSPYCTIGEHYYDGDCGSSGWARALFVSWNILSMYIFFNLFVSLIYESFSYVYQRSSGLSVITREEIRRFKQAWAEFDPNGTGYISKEMFPRLLGELSGVFEMRIYDGDFTVRTIIEDCKQRSANTSTLAFDGPSEPVKLDLERLNERLAEIPVEQIRRRRIRMNTFYEEVLVSADLDRGIEFNSLLMILAHYKVINDNKSLRLEEFLRRRARLQRVDEAVRRNIVIGFFDTLYWSRRFRRAVEGRKHARMTAVPQLDVPEIFVHDPAEADAERANRAHSPSSLAPTTPIDREAPSWTTGSEPSADDRVGILRNRSESIQISPSASPTRGRFPRAGSSPTRSGSVHSHSPSGSMGARGTISPVRENWHFAEALANAGQYRARSPSPTHLDFLHDNDADDGAASSSPARGRASTLSVAIDPGTGLPYPARSRAPTLSVETGSAGAGVGRSRAGTLSVQGYDGGMPAGGRSRAGTLSVENGGRSRAGTLSVEDGARSRAGSSVSARDVLDVLDNSAWGESIRRSFTMRRTSSGGGGDGGGGGGGSPT
ncbi:hypothetical protein MBLNU459_g7040t3 [Dothideomycetes sp. NU459]